MGRDIGYVYIILHKESNLYKVGRTINEERRFKELDVGGSTKLVKSYKVFNHSSVEKLCHRAFANKRLPQSEYFKLTDEELNEIKKILEENKFKTKKTLRAERDARWIENLKLKRKKYSQLSRYKKFTTRNQNKLAAGLMIPIGCLIALPLFGLIVAFLESFGLNQYYLIVPTFAFYFWVLWINEQQDKEVRDQLFKNEDLLIKEHLESWERIDASTDAYEDRKDQ